MKKSALIFAVVLLIACKTSHKTTYTVVHDDNFEILNGKVKQITKITKEQYSLDTIVDFDVHGIITQINSKGGCDCLIKYAFKYDKDGKPTESTEKHGLLPRVYKYDKNGRIIEESQYTKMLRDNSDHILKQDKYFYKYDFAGYLIKFDYYVDTEHKFLVKYKYNDQHLLIETDRFLDSGYLEDKITYKYQTIDAKRNWLKRTVSINIDNKPFETDTNTRKIIYY